MKTKVIFRVHEGEVLAMFPELPGNNNPSTCLCYSHYGQHGIASAVSIGRPATKKEYTPLYEELDQIYNGLRVMSRFPRNSYAMRAHAIWRMK